MMPIPKKVQDRFQQRLKQFQTILKSAQDRDVNESDTVTIIVDVLAEMFGYDKYSEITKEQAVRQTFCDLAIRLNGKMTLLLEVKAIGLQLKDNHVSQAINYCANCGTEWVILTNGVMWRFYRVIFGQPINQELVFELNLLEANPKNENHLDQFFCIAKEGHCKLAVVDYHTQKEAASRFNLAALLLAEPMLKALRKELKSLNPDVRIELEDIKTVLMNEVLKRDCVEGEKAEEARKMVAKVLRKLEKAKAARTPVAGIPSVNPNDTQAEAEAENDTVNSELAATASETENK